MNKRRKLYDLQIYFVFRFRKNLLSVNNKRCTSIGCILFFQNSTVTVDITTKTRYIMRVVTIKVTTIAICEYAYRRGYDIYENEGMNIMTIEECIAKLTYTGIDSLEIATVDENGYPQVRVVSARFFEGTTMYFLTSRGKAFVRQMENNPHVAVIGFDEKANDMVRLTGVAEKVPEEEQIKYRTKMYEYQPYLENVYPGETKNIDVMFRISKYTLEYFTLATHPIEREYFEVDGAERYPKGYFITDRCIGCGTCQGVCPQKSISSGAPFVIQQKHCLQCGNCYEHCPVQAIEWQGRQDHAFNLNKAVEEDNKRNFR